MAKTKKKYPKRDIYQETTDKLLARMDAGDLPPWSMPIVTAEKDRFPKNFLTGKDYRGVNVWLLALTAWTEGFNSAQWLTFKQAKEKGGQVRKGEKGSLVTFWTTYEKEDKATEEKTILPVLKHYTVFNLDQIDDIVTPEMAAIKTSFEPIAKAEAILQGYAGGPEINHQGNRGTYYPERDVIEIAPPEHFITPEQYYATVFHECAHSTGHKKRLKRGIEEKGAPKGSEGYSKEELVAEMASAYLCAIAGIGPATIDNAAAYIKGWSKSLKQDKKLFITAAGQAQKAADLILGTTFEAEAKPTPPAHSLTPKREEIPIEAKSQLDLF